MLLFSISAKADVITCEGCNTKTKVHQKWTGAR